MSDEENGMWEQFMAAQQEFRVQFMVLWSIVVLMGIATMVAGIVRML